MRALIAVTLIAAAAALNCGTGVVANGYCACASSYMSSNSSMTDCNVHDALCDPLPAVSLLVTESVGSLNSLSLNAGIISFMINSPARDNRVITSIQLGPNTNTVCSYPGMNFNKTFGDCVDVVNADIPWTDAYYACGLSSFSQMGDEYVYDSHIYMTVTDDLGMIRGNPIQRVTDTAVAVGFHVPTTFNATVSNILLASAVNIEVAVISQSLDINRLQLHLTLYTSVQGPYQLNAMRQAWNGTVIYGYPECSGDCVQTWDVVLNLGPESCSFSGDYVFQFDVVCQPGVQECPTHDTSSTGSIGFDVDSTVTVSISEDNLCNAFDIYGETWGSLASYDSSYAIERMAFLQGDTGYFQLDLSSTMGLDAVLFKRITVINDSTQQRLVIYDSGNTALGDAVSLVLNEMTAAGATSASSQFEFTLSVGVVGSGALFEVANVDAAFTFSVEVVTDVAYYGQFSRRRETSTHTLKYATQALLTPATDAFGVEDASSMLAPMMVPVLLGAAGAVMNN